MFSQYYSEIIYEVYRQYDNQDMPLVAEFNYEELKDEDHYDPYFKNVQKSYDDVRNSWKREDYFSNLKLRDELDK